MMVWAIVAIGALSFIVWAHHMYVSGMNPYFGFFFATTTLIIAIPTAIKVYNWVLTLWRGDIQINIPNLFAIGFIFTFVHGGLTGLFLGNVTVDLPLSDTYFVIGHFHMVMGVSPVMVLFGAIYHWFPKMTGKMPNEFLGRMHFWMTFLGTYAIYLPMHYLGILGMPRRYYAYGNTDFIPESAHAVNEAITIAAIVVATAQVIFLINVFYSLRKGKSRRTIRGARRRSSGRRRRRRRCTATGVRSCPSSIAGRTTTACRARRRTSSRRTSRRKATLARGVSDRRAMLTAMVIAMLTAITVWWLLIQRLKDKPWTKQGVMPTSPEGATSSAPKIGLWLFLAVVSSFFGIFASAYFMRMARARRARGWHRSPNRACCGSTRWSSCSRAARCRSRATAWTRRLRGGRAYFTVAGLLTCSSSAAKCSPGARDGDRQLGTGNPAYTFFMLLTAITACTCSAACSCSAARRCASGAASSRPRSSLAAGFA